ncbi:MAG: peptidoglycan-binding domain-containing protein [Rhodobacterales bacterium]
MTAFRAAIFISLMGATGFYAVPANAQNIDLPPSARPGACYIRNIRPAVIETVTEQILTRPEKRRRDPETGQEVIISSATYRTRTVQKIIRPRRETWAETICPRAQNPDMIASLQRALAARGHYRGSISGIMDDRTRRALRRAQKKIGINSNRLTVDLAESYGLIIHRIFAQ